MEFSTGFESGRSWGTRHAKRNKVVDSARGSRLVEKKKLFRIRSSSNSGNCSRASFRPPKSLDEPVILPLDVTLRKWTDTSACQLNSQKFTKLMILSPSSSTGRKSPTTSKDSTEKKKLTIRRSPFVGAPTPHASAHHMQQTNGETPPVGHGVHLRQLKNAWLLTPRRTRLWFVAHDLAFAG